MTTTSASGASVRMIFVGVQSVHSSHCYVHQNHVGRNLVGTEELNHLEIVGALARLHLRPLKANRRAAEIDPLIAIAGGGGVALHNSMGDAWTADYLKITGELDVDLRSDIAAEARAKIVYERLIQFTDDAGSIRALQFLMTREISPMKAFQPLWRA